MQELSLVLLVTLGISISMPKRVGGYETRAFPPFSLKIVDDKDTPVQNACVMMHWENYSFEKAEHCEAQVSDVNGSVNFPETKVQGSVLRRAFGPSANFVTYLAHASGGIHGNVVVWKDHWHGHAILEPDRPLPDQIQLSLDPSVKNGDFPVRDSVTQCSCK